MALIGEQALPGTATNADLHALLCADPRLPALVTGAGGFVDRGDLLARAEDVRERLGDDRRLVFLEASNTVEGIAAYLGCLLGGHPVYLFADDNEAVQALAKRYRPDVFMRPTHPVAMEWSDPIAGRELHPSLALLLSTSGSTGSPKFVKLSLRNLIANARSIAEYLEIGTADRAVTSLSFAYSYGLSVVNSHLFAGGSLLLNDLSIADPAFWDNLVRGGGTSFAGVPYTFELLGIAAPGWAATPGLRHITQAGGRLAPDKVATFAELGRLHDWRFYVMYGQTECAPRIAYLPPDRAVEYPDCIGVAIPGGRIELVDEDGTTVEGPGVTGEMVYSGPNVMMGYAETDSELATDDTPARHRTGDLACRNEAGLFRIVGRLSRFVKPFGLRVNLDELEQLLAPGFAGAACTGTDQLIVVALAGADRPRDQELAAFVAARLKLPPAIVQVVPVAEIPRLANGKTDYRRILALASEAATTTAPPPETLWRELLSVSFVRKVIVEIGQIVGLAHPQWRGVRHIYATLLNVPAVPDDASFVTLAGDSLTYVQASVALQDYLGHLPARWENMTIAELEQEGAAEQTF